MYKIISIPNKSHVVVYEFGHLTLNFFQSYDYNQCVEYIDMKEQSEELYNECNFQRYNDNKS